MPRTSCSQLFQVYTALQKATFNQRLAPEDSRSNRGKDEGMLNMQKLTELKSYISS